MCACRVKNYYDRFNKVNSPNADGNKKKGGRGAEGGEFESVNNNNIIYDEAPKKKNKLVETDRKPVKTLSKVSKQASRLCMGETIEAKLKALPVLAIAVNQIITIPDFILHKCN